MWRAQRRRAQLDRLYEVREVLQERVQQAVQQQNVLEGQRERAVQNELQKRRLVHHHPSGGGGTGGLEAFDFESTVFAFPDANRENGGLSLLLGLKEDDDGEEEEYQRFLEQQEGSDDDRG